MDYHNPPSTESGSHQDQTCAVKCDTSTPKITSNQLGTISRHNMERPNLTKIPLQQHIERQINDMDSKMKTHKQAPKKIDLMSPSEYYWADSRTYKNNH